MSQAVMSPETVSEASAHARQRSDLALASLCVALGFGALYAGPVYRAAAATEFRWSQEVTAGAFALGFIVAIPVSIIAGLAADRWGTHLVLAAGAGTTGIALLLGAATSGLWQWYATAGVTLAIGVRTVLSAASLLASVGERRGRSLGVIFGATGIGLTLGPPLTQVLAEALGWRSVMAFEGMASTVLALLLMRVSRQPFAAPAPVPVAPGRMIVDSGHIRAVPLAGFFVGNLLVGLYDESVYQHIYAYGTALGLSGLAAAGVISVVSLAYTVGAIGGGTLSDMVGRRPLLVLSALGSAAALLGLTNLSADILWLCGAAFGLALGMTISVRSAAWADAFAGSRLGRDIGFVTPGYSVGAAIATYGGAAWLDAGGGFQALYAAAASAAVLWAIVGAALTRSRPRTSR